MKLVLASQNKKKLVEMNDILSSLGIEVCSQADAGVDQIGRASCRDRVLIQV